MHNMDPRAIRTEKMLKKALFQLLKADVPLHQISVQKLTATAGLNRTTFYLHYENMEELRDQLVTESLHVLTEKVENLSAVLHKDRTNQLMQLLYYLQSQRDQFIVLAQFEQLEQHLFELMKKLIQTRREYTKSKSTHAMVHLDVKTASIVGLIIWWLKNGQHLSVDVLTEQIHFMYKSRS